MTYEEAMVLLTTPITSLDQWDDRLIEAQAVCKAYESQDHMTQLKQRMTNKLAAIHALMNGMNQS